MRRRGWVLPLLLAAALFVVITRLLAAPLPQTGAITEISDVKSFWAMAQMAGNIGYLIFGVLAVGLFLILLKGLELFSDRRAAGTILKANFDNMAWPDIEALSQAGKQSVLQDITRHQLALYRAVGHAGSMKEEISSFIDQQYENFEAFRDRLYFLSDSAGALGLLGTVWGVFLTFFGGNLDSEKILNGMGVALVTTLLGLVVSLIINLSSTEIYSFFHRRMEHVNDKADELRLRLLQFDQSRRRQASA